MRVTRQIALAAMLLIVHIFLDQDRVKKTDSSDVIPSKIYVSWSPWQRISLWVENNTGYEYPTGLSADYEQVIELTRELSVYFMT